VLSLIERQASGEEIAATPQAEEETPAPDLMAALEASLAAVRSGPSDEPSAAETKKPPARQRAAKPKKSPAKAKS
jgi:non-homologous end joining protein Ku